MYVKQFLQHGEGGRFLSWSSNAPLGPSQNDKPRLTFLRRCEAACAVKVSELKRPYTSQIRLGVLVSDFSCDEHLLCSGCAMLVLWHWVVVMHVVCSGSERPAMLWWCTCHSVSVDNGYAHHSIVNVSGPCRLQHQQTQFKQKEVASRLNMDLFRTHPSLIQFCHFWSLHQWKYIMCLCSTGVRFKLYKWGLWRNWPIQLALHLDGGQLLQQVFPVSLCIRRCSFCMQSIWNY